MISKKECKVGHGLGYTLVEIISILKCTEGQGGKYYLGRWSQKWKMECKEGQGRKNWSEVRNARWAGRAGAAGFSQIRRRALIQIRWEAEAQFTSRAWFNQICMMQWFWQSEKLGITLEWAIAASAGMILWKKEKNIDMLVLGLLAVRSYIPAVPTIFNNALKVSYSELIHSQICQAKSQVMPRAVKHVAPSA